MISPFKSSIRNRDIVCFSHDWGGDPLSKNHLMRLLARNNRVLWVNSIGYRAPRASRADIGRAFKKLVNATLPLREAEPNLFVFNPLAVPCYGRAWMRRVNCHCLGIQIKQAMRRLGFKRPISWIFNPAAAIVAGKLGEERLIYHCVDEYSAFSGVAPRALAELEEQLLARADLVITSSDRLYQAKRRGNSNTFLVRHGVDHEHFRLALAEDTQIPEEIARLRKPVIGYFGLIAEDWFDIDLMRRVAERFHDASVMLLGKTTMDVSSLAHFPNVRFLGRKPYESLPAYCKGFDVALIPFPINEVTLNANPLKAREYLAAGVPVVSTAIPEVRVLNHCRVAADKDEFLSQIEKALTDRTARREISESVCDQSWKARLQEIERAMTAAAPSRKSQTLRFTERLAA